MTAAYGTGPEFVPVPVDLGQALAFPGIYLEAPAGLPAAVPARRVRRPGRMRRRVAVIAAVAAAAGLAGCGATYRVPAPAGTPWLPTQAARALHAIPAELGRAHHSQREARHPRRRAAAGCHTPAMPDGSTISVDQAGNATAPYTGGLGFRCADGRWVQIASPATAPAQPQRLAWDGRHPAVWTSPVDPTCEARIAGRHSVARSGVGGPVFGVVCVRDGSEFAWGVVSGGAR